MAEDMDLSGLADMLGNFLSDDSNKQQIQNVLSMFGGEKDEKTPPGMATGGINPENIQLMFKLQQIMSEMNNPEAGKQTALLQALKPLLRPERREKIDNAVRFLGIGRAIEVFKKIEGV